VKKVAERPRAPFDTTSQSSDPSGRIASSTIAPQSTVTATFTGPAGAGFYTVPPCRALDSRQPTGPWGGTPLVAGQQRTVVVGGTCGVPPTATALSFNLTVTAPTAAGGVRLYAAGTSMPVGSIVNFRAGETRANNGVASMGVGGALALFSGPSGSVHVVLDVDGYFE